MPSHVVASDSSDTSSISSSPGSVAICDGDRISVSLVVSARSLASLSFLLCSRYPGAPYGFSWPGGVSVPQILLRNLSVKLEELVCRRVVGGIGKVALGFEAAFEARRWHLKQTWADRGRACSEVTEAIFPMPFLEAISIFRNGGELMENNVAENNLRTKTKPILGLAWHRSLLRRIKNRVRYLSITLRCWLSLVTELSSFHVVSFNLMLGNNRYCSALIMPSARKTGYQTSSRRISTARFKPSSLPEVQHLK